MLNLTFNGLSLEQAQVLLSAYQSTKPMTSNVIPFPGQPQPAEAGNWGCDPAYYGAEPIAHHANGEPVYPQAPAEPIPQPVPEPPVAPPAAVVPTAAAPAYTFDDLARAAAPLMDAGKTPDLQALLRSFNVQALTQLPKDQYGAFATALRGMGARL